MQTTKTKGLNISKLTLGTVQFGLNYGIANKTGQPSYETARDIIKSAYEGGVTCLDTAAAYGNSEEVLGKVLSELGIASEMVVETKICPMPDNLPSVKADAIVEESVTNSLKQLRLESIPLCLFHTENNCVQYWESLLKMKNKGYVKNIGVSVNSPSIADSILNAITIDAMQMPTSILDQRYIRQGICGAAQKKNIALFVRSIYLQGLLFIPEDEIQPALSDVIPVRRQLKMIAKSAGMELAELAVRYVLSLSEITSLLVGVESVEQMKQNIELFAKGPLDLSLFNAVSEAVPNLSNAILFPSLWPQK